LWAPPGVAQFKTVLVLVPGSNGDGRSQADDEFWRAFAVKEQAAIVACRFTDKKHEQGFIEEYVNVSQGSGQALLDALGQFAAREKHPEIATAPLLLWGMSAGGEFNYEFVAWKPERVAAFIVNKGGIYYTALASKAARAVPGILFVGGKDLDSRTFTIKGLFGVNRRAGALWALAEEPGLEHVVGHSKELGAMLFEDVLATPQGSLTEKSGFVGDVHTFAIQPASTASTANILTSWLPTERLANAWKAVVTSTPPVKH
jgi:dienelactone hydrolase